jgi:hypothetical protein
MVEVCCCLLDPRRLVPYERRSSCTKAMASLDASVAPKLTRRVSLAHACCSPTTTTMVSSLLVEALSSPTDVLLSFYDTCDHEAINEFPNAVAKHFSDIFRTDDAFLEVRIHIQSQNVDPKGCNPRYLLSSPHVPSLRTAIAPLSASAHWSKTLLHPRRCICPN